MSEFVIEIAGSLTSRPTVQLINPLTPELNPSAQRCLTRFFTGCVLAGPFVGISKTD
jgi:hypothetical protein